MAELPLDQAIPRFKANENRMDIFTNGSDTADMTTSGGVAVPSIRKFLKTKDTEINTAANNIRSAAQAAATLAQAWAESASAPGAAGTKSAKTLATEAAASASNASTHAGTALNRANLAQAWAESATAPGGGGTKSAKTWAAEAAASAGAISGWQIPYTPETLVGMTMTNSPGDLQHDIVVSPGQRRDVADANNITLGSGIVKRIDAAWSAGNNGGGLDTGTVAANKTYFVHVIKNTTTNAVDVLISASPTNPVMPSGFTSRRRLGAIITDASANILPFRQDGGWFYHLDAFEDLVGSVTGGYAQSVTLSRMPLGIKVIADVSFHCSGGSAAVLGICDQDLGDATINDCVGVFGAAATIFNVKIQTDNARRVNVFSSGNGTIYVYSRGWFDDRAG